MKDTLTTVPIRDIPRTCTYWACIVRPCPEETLIQPPQALVESFKFLCVHITKELSQSTQINTVVKRAPQLLFPLQRLERFGMGPQILKKSYSCTIKSILTGCITAWYGSCLASDRKALQRVVYQYIPVNQDLYNRQCQRKALKIVKDSSHPSHRVFSLLPHGKRYRCTKAGNKQDPEQLLPPSYKTATQLVKQLTNSYPEQSALTLFALDLLTYHIGCCYCLLSTPLPSHFIPTYMYISTSITSYTCTSTRYWYPVYIAKLSLLNVYLLLLIITCFSFLLLVYFLSLCIVGKCPSVRISLLVYTCCLRSILQI